MLSVSKSVGELIADDSILYQQSGVMLPSLLPLSQSSKITLIEAVQIILLKVILENDNQGGDLSQDSIFP